MGIFRLSTFKKVHFFCMSKLGTRIISYLILKTGKQDVIQIRSSVIDYRIGVMRSRMEYPSPLEVQVETVVLDDYEFYICNTDQNYQNYYILGPSISTPPYAFHQNRKLYFPAKSKISFATSKQKITFPVKTEKSQFPVSLKNHVSHQNRKIVFSRQNRNITIFHQNQKSCFPVKIKKNCVFLQKKSCFPTKRKIGFFSSKP